MKEIGFDSLDFCPIGLGEMKFLLAALVKSKLSKPAIVNSWDSLDLCPRGLGELVYLWFSVVP